MIIYMLYTVAHYLLECLVLIDTIRKLRRVTGDKIQITNKMNHIIGESTIKILRQPIGVN